MHVNQTWKLTRRWLGVVLLGAMALGPQAGWTQAPQPVRLLVGYTPGGPVDTMARLFAPAFAKELGVPVVVENRPGAGGAIAGEVVSKATPNGLLLFFAASPTMTITPHILKSMPFDPVKGVVAIAPILSYANVLVVNKEQPFKTIPELVAYAKAHPGKVAYGSAGMGASNHLSGELFALRTDTQLNHVPYKGNAPAMTDVMGGQIQMMFDIIAGSRVYIASGRVQALAVTSRERNAALPDVPTMREVGIPDYEVGGWFGLYGPAKLPPEIVAHYNEATRRVLASDAMKNKLAEFGYDPWPGPPQTLADRAAQELALWATVTKGIQVQ